MSLFESSNPEQRQEDTLNNIELLLEKIVKILEEKL